MFGVIYKNTQIHLLKDTLMSFGFSLNIPFIFYLLLGILRIPSLSNTNNRREDHIDLHGFWNALRSSASRISSVGWLVVYTKSIGFIIFLHDEQVHCFIITVKYFAPECYTAVFGKRK